MTRLAVTTDRAVACDMYAALGFEPVHLPCIAVEPAASEVLAEARRAVATADLVLITSVRTVELLWPKGALPDAEFAAVGSPTARAITGRGGRVGAVGASGLADLVATVSDRLGETEVVFPRAAGSDPAALATLRSQAPQLREIVVYETTPLAPGDDPVDAVVFASPSAVVGWALSRVLEGLVVGAIGGTTASGLSRVDVVAPEPTHAALAQALATYMEVLV